MNEAAFILAVALCAFMFAGEPDLHDFLVEKIQSAECHK